MLRTARLEGGRSAMTQQNAQIPLTRRELGALAGSLLGTCAMPAAAQETLDRGDVLIAEAWPAGPTFRNFNNLNPFAVGNDLRNHAAFVLEPLFYWLNL